MNYFKLLIAIMLPVAVFSQNISGVVVNKKGDPLQGITVSEKGTRQSIVTNSSGSFSLNCSHEACTLIFSGIGYESTEVKTDGQTSIRVTLSIKINLLDEVQVVAYGTNTQRYNVGSVTKVKAEDIEKQPVSNPLLTLQGRVPGLVITSPGGLPGSAIKIQVRGQNTLKNSSTSPLLPIDNPLFIIDGVPFAPQNESINQLSSIQGPAPYSSYNKGFSPFNNFNPGDIESIEVLRDADATAIYGSRGGNGVILITTKKGKVGKTDFSLNILTGTSLIGKTVSMMSTQQYLAMRREAIANDGLTPNLTQWDDAYAPDLLVFDAQKNTNWKKYFLSKPAQTITANTFITGGNEGTQFRLSAAYNKSTYIFPGNYSDNRLSFSSNIIHRSIDKKLNIAFSSNYSYNKNNSSGSSELLEAFILEPNYPDLQDKNGNPIWSYGGVDLGYAPRNNPVSYLRNIYNIQGHNLTSNLNIGYQFLKNLTVRVSLGYNIFLSKEYSGNPKSAQNPLFGEPASAEFGTNNYSTWITEPQVEYLKSFGSSSLSVLAGSTLQSSINQRQTISSSGYLHDGLIESISAGTDHYITDAYSQYKYAAIFGRISYRLANKYILSLTGRRDGSSRFGAGRQFGNFGSAGGGWIFSEERLLKNNLKWLSFGKVRGSYGITGSDAIADYQYISRWAPTSRTYEDLLGYLPQNLENPLLAWAETKKAEIGLDLGFLQDRVLFNATRFQNLSGNQLVAYRLPEITGFSNISANWNALIKNTGWEIMLQSINVKSKNLTWTSAFNISFPRNNLTRFPGIESSPYSTTYQIGKPVNSIFGFNSAGVNENTGLFQFRTAVGELTSNPQSPSSGIFNDFTYIGTLDPKFYGGLSNSIIYKGFQMDFLIEFRKQLGLNYLQQVYSYLPGTEVNLPISMQNRWRHPGDHSDIQRLSVQYGDAYHAGYNFSISNGAYSDASYIRFKTVSISYDLKQSLVENTNIKGMQIYIHAQNLFTIKNYKGDDPETQNIYGVPILKTIVFGLQLTL